MSKGKKIYCAVTGVIGLILLCMIVILVNATAVEVKATSTITQEDRVGSDSDYDEVTDNDGRITDSDQDAAGNGFSITYNNGDGSLSGPLRILLVLTAISLLPTALIMLTSFTRVLIVLHFTRQALNTQTAPSNMILVGISVILTIFIMNPVFTEINENALKPLDAGEITTEQALEAGMKPLREFMYGQTQVKDLNLFLDISGYEDAESEEDVPFYVLVPSFVLSELRTAFIIGFLIYIPFIVIDMVIASILMAMGMMMLPPTTISMPFKILLFVLADGWNLVIGGVVKTFY